MSRKPFNIDEKDLGFAETVTHRNPSTSQAQDKAETVASSRRGSLAVAKSRFFAPTIPGYWVTWINDLQGRLQQALECGYEFVRAEEFKMENFNVSAQVTVSGSSDMGERISIQAGLDGAGQPYRSYMMKLPMEYHLEDVRLQQAAANRPLDQIKRGALNGSDPTTYVKNFDISRR